MIETQPIVVGDAETTGRRGAAPEESRETRWSRTSLWLTYTVPILVAVAVTQLWFRPGSFVATGDVAPFIRHDLLSGGLAMWSHSLTGAGSPSFVAFARAPELGALGLTSALHLPETAAQRIFYGFSAAALAGAVVFFVLAFVDRLFAAGLAGVFALVNAFVLQHLPNPLTLWSIALMAAVGGVVLRAGMGRDIPTVVLGLLSMGVGYLALNPPLVLVSAAWSLLVALLAEGLVGKGARRRSVRYLLRALPWVVVLNVWWAVPWLFTLGHAGTGFVVSAETNVEAWAWTQARSSIPNVLALTGHWGWAFPEYFPYARAMDRGLWGLMAFALPALAFLAPFVALPGRRRSARRLALMALSLVLLAKGLHPPFSSMNAFLYDHVPLMWLLREPLSKIGPGIVLCYVVMIAMTVEGVLDLRRREETRPIRSIGRTTLVLAAAALLYPYPVWTGSVIPDQRPLLPPAHVQVPSAWRDLAELINAAPDDGKVLVLPLDDYYQMPTTWGYYGIDSIPRSLLEPSTIQILPQSYFGEVPSFRTVLEGIQRALLSRDVDAVSPLLRALGVSYVIVRHDIDTTYPRPSIQDPAPLRSAIEQVPGLSRVASFDVADVYHLSGSAGAHVLVSANPITLYGGDPGDLPLAIAGLAGDVVTQQHLAGAPGGSVSVLAPGDPPITLSSGAPLVTLSPRLIGEQVFRVDVSSQKSKQIVSFEPEARLSVDGRPVDLTPALRTTFSGAGLVALGVGDYVVPLDSGQPTLALSPGARVTAYRSVGGQTLRPLESQGVSDCNAYDQRSIREVGIEAENLAGEPPIAVRLSARDHAACVSTPVAGFVPGATYLVRLQYRSLQGRPARVCLWQAGPSDCAVMPPLDDSRKWKTYTAAVVPERGTVGMRLYFYADGQGSGNTTVTEYRDGSVVRIRPTGTKSVDVRAPRPTMVEVGSGPKTFALGAPKESELAPLSGAVGDCNAYDKRSTSQVGIMAANLPNQPSIAVRLSAQDHSACVSSPVTGFVPGATYIVSLQYRSFEGRPARVCLWQEGPDRCAVMLPMKDSSTWRTYEATVVPERSTVGLRLFLYADAGAEGGTTVTEYRGVRVGLRSPLAVAVIRRATGELESPTSWSARTSSDEYLVRVAASDRPFLLSLDESRTDGWRLDGVPSNRSVDPVTADGYAQGWWIQPGSALTLRISYGPDTWARRSVLISLVGLVVAIAALVRRWRLRRNTDGVIVPQEADTHSVI